MEKKPTCNRRCFIIESTKITAGISLLGSGLLSFKPQDEFDLISYCFINCETCPTFKAGNCGSCKSENIHDAYKSCTVRACASEKGLPTCAHCVDLAGCNKKLWQNWPSQKDYCLRKQKELGINDIKNNMEDMFYVYPVPVLDNLTISNPKLLDAEFKFYGLHGQILIEGKFSTDKYELDLSGLSSGNYMIAISENNKLLFTRRIIKN